MAHLTNRDLVNSKLAKEVAVEQQLANLALKEAYDALTVAKELGIGDVKDLARLRECEQKIRAYNVALDAQNMRVDEYTCRMEKTKESLMKLADTVMSIVEQKDWAQKELRAVNTDIFEMNKTREEYIRKINQSSSVMLRLKRSILRGFQYLRMDIKQQESSLHGNRYEKLMEKLKKSLDPSCDLQGELHNSKVFLVKANQLLRHSEQILYDNKKTRPILINIKEFVNDFGLDLADLSKYNDFVNSITLDIDSLKKIALLFCSGIRECEFKKNKLNRQLQARKKEMKRYEDEIEVGSKRIKKAQMGLKEQEMELNSCIDKEKRRAMKIECASWHQEVQPLIDALVLARPNWQARQGLTRPLRRKLMTECQVKSLSSKLQNIKVLDHGAFSAVYLLSGQEWCGHSEVIIKLNNGKQNYKEISFEAKILLELDGAGKAPLLYGFYPEAGVILMEYAGNETFKSILTREGANAPSDKLLLQLVDGIAEATTEINAAGYAHCDLHGGNATFTFTPEGRPLAHILDFGLSAAIGEKGRLARSDCHAAMGRWPWYAHEAMRGHVNEKTDLPAIGHFLRLALLKSKGRISSSDKLWHIVLASAENNPEKRPSLSRIRLILRWYIQQMDNEMASMAQSVSGHASPSEDNRLDISDSVDES